MRLMIATAALLTFLAAGTASAGSCLDDVRRLAEAHRLSADPPSAAPRTPNSAPTDDLARSRGVIAPPPMSDRSVIAPPDNVDPGMKTVPQAAPDSAQKPAADRTALQSILTAARADAERGDEARCREQLARAHRLLAGSPL